MKKLYLFIVMALSVTAMWAQPEAGKTPGKHNVNRLSADYFIPGRFEGKTIFITGGARGIGKWTAIRAAKEGANVVIMDWLDKDGQHVADSLNALGLKALFVYGDIQKDEDCRAAVEKTIGRYGRLDYACLNAGVMDGVFSGTPFKYDEAQRKLMPNVITQATDEYWDKVFATNAAGTFKSMRAVLNRMIEQDNGGALLSW